MTNWQESTKPSIQQLSPYVPGKPIEALERELGITNIIKLASNENPLGCSTKAISGMKEALALNHRYSDPASFELKEKLSQKHECAHQQLVLGNGSDECFRLLAQCYVNPGEEIIVSDYGFVAYSVCAASYSAKIVKIPTIDWVTQLDKLPSLITEQTKMVFLANPNNPTGTFFTHDQLTEVLKQIPKHIIVVLDEAYYEYANAEATYPNSHVLRQQYENLVVTRTFSKAYGLAGCRIGYAIAHPDIADVLNRIRLPFNINLVAQAAALAVLDDDEFIHKSVEVNQAGMQQLKAGFNELKLNNIPSLGNFITLDCNQAASPVYEQLLHQGVIVRPLANYQMPNHLRISIGTYEENERLLNGLSKIIV